MMLINYYTVQDKMIHSMRGTVPPTEGSEIVFASPDLEHEPPSWEVVRVRNFHWFDQIECCFEQAVNVYVRKSKP